MPYLEVAASRLYYELHGEGDAVVLAHGVGGNHASWFNQVPTLAQRHRVVLIDQRGFGNSTDAEGLGRSGFVRDLELLLDHLAIESAVLVGQSMGGGTCSGFTCAHPDRVRALVMADTLVGLALPEEIAPFMAQNEAAMLNLTQAERVLGPRTRRDEPERTLLYLQIASFNEVALRTLRGRFEPNGPEALAATGVPMLFIVGEDDILFPPRAVRCVQQHVPGARFVQIPGAGHSAYFEQPQAFNRELLAFLDTLQ